MTVIIGLYIGRYIGRYIRRYIGIYIGISNEIYLFQDYMDSNVIERVAFSATHWSTMHRERIKVKIPLKTIQ